MIRNPALNAIDRRQFFTSWRAGRCLTRRNNSV